MKTHFSEPDGRFHLAIQTPDGYGFEAIWEKPQDFYAALDALARCSKESGGISKAIQHMVKRVTTVEGK